jgi:hypothetical protein
VPTGNDLSLVELNNRQGEEPGIGDIAASDALSLPNHVLLREILRKCLKQSLCSCSSHGFYRRQFVVGRE